MLTVEAQSGEVSGKMFVGAFIQNFRRRTGGNGNRGPIKC